MATPRKTTIEKAMTIVRNSQAAGKTRQQILPILQARLNLAEKSSWTYYQRCKSGKLA